LCFLKSLKTEHEYSTNPRAKRGTPKKKNTHMVIGVVETMHGIESKSAIPDEIKAKSMRLGIDMSLPIYNVCWLMAGNAAYGV
jgi:hypothetical protein